MTLTPTISGNDIHVQCDINRWDEADKSVLLIRARDLAQAVIDLGCFSQGLGAYIAIERFVGTDGRLEELILQDKSLSTLCTAFQLGPAPNPTLTTILGIVLRDPPVFMALNDLILAITIPHHAPVNCARAIDGIRHLISPDLDRTQSWKSLRDNLNVTKDFLDLITATSVAPRHGDRRYISGPATSEVVRRSWIVMNRFLEFKKRGNSQLPLSEFPVLAE